MSELTTSALGNATGGSVQARSSPVENSPCASRAGDLVLADNVGRATGDPCRSTFQSILYEEPTDGSDHTPPEAPAYFRDLNLDQIVDTITAGKKEYDLQLFFHAPLKTTAAIRYRQEVMRDLENNQTLKCIKTFADGMRLMREKLAQADKLYHNYQKKRWFLHAVETYCVAVQELAACISLLQVSSGGLVAFRDYVTAYADSDRFGALLAAANKLTGDLTAVQYSIQIKGDTFKVRKYDSERDYSVEVLETFKKFQQGAARDYRVEFHKTIQMNHIEAKVLDFVALLHPETFASLDAFAAQNSEYVDRVVKRFDREIQFYVAYVDYTAAFTRAGLKFSYPAVSPTEMRLHIEETFDLALATKLIAKKMPIICNDFDMAGKERIFVVSGPNQGGKTTFARTFGQLHHLASIGCPVPGRSARLFLFDSMFTHFDKKEDITNLHGKLQDDLIRVHGILEEATPRSIIIMNEIFNSTTLADAVFLARQVMTEIIKLDCLCVCVTFLDELASLSEKTVSMVSTVVPDNPAERTFRVVRRPADGLSYAISIAEKYRVTYECLKARIQD
jgi:DNA mismatch repair protein MutS